MFNSCYSQRTRDDDNKDDNTDLNYSINQGDDKTTTEIMQCCLDSCRKPIDYCIGYCKENLGENKQINTPIIYKKCIETCKDYRTSCINKCQLSSNNWSILNPYVKCQEEAGCILDIKMRGLNRKCTEQNKKKIYDCCIDNCVNTHDLNCDEHCKLSENLYTKDIDYIDKQADTENIIHNFKDISSGKNKKNWHRKKDNDTLLPYILFFVLLGAIISVFIITFFSRKYKN